MLPAQNDMHATNVALLFCTSLTKLHGPRKIYDFSKEDTGRLYKNTAWLSRIVYSRASSKGSRKKNREKLHNNSAAQLWKPPKYLFFVFFYFPLLVNTWDVGYQRHIHVCWFSFYPTDGGSARYTRLTRHDIYRHKHSRHLGPGRHLNSTVKRALFFYFSFLVLARGVTGLKNNTKQPRSSELQSWNMAITWSVTCNAHFSLLDWHEWKAAS